MTKKSNIIPFPKTNVREVKIKEQRELIENQKEEIMKSILDDKE